MENFGNTVRTTGSVIRGRVCQFAQTVSNGVRTNMHRTTQNNFNPEDLPSIADLPTVRKIILTPSATASTQTEQVAPTPDCSARVDAGVQHDVATDTGGDDSSEASIPTAKLGYRISHFDRVKLCESAVERNGLALRYVPRELLTDKLEHKAVKSNGLSLQFIPEHRRTAGLCTLAVRQNGLAIRYVPDYLKSLQLCKSAVAQNPSALEWCYIN